MVAVVFQVMSEVSAWVENRALRPANSVFHFPLVMDDITKLVIPRVTKRLPIPIGDGMERNGTLPRLRRV